LPEEDPIALITQWQRSGDEYWLKGRDDQELGMGRTLAGRGVAKKKRMERWEQSQEKDQGKESLFYCQGHT
jgi:hypothetical protein